MKFLRLFQSERFFQDDDDDAAAVDAANSTVSSVYQPATPFWSAQAKAAEPAKSLESADKPKEPVTSTEQPTSVFGGAHLCSERLLPRSVSAM